MVRLLVIFYLCMSVLFGWLFVADLQGRFKTVPNPIAVLKDSRGTVRRLGAKELTWTRVQDGRFVGANDTISTGEGGGVRIVFLNGSAELVLESGSMVVLGGSIEELKLDFQAGGGKIRRAKQAQTKVIVKNTAPVAPRAKTVASASPPMSRNIVEEFVDQGELKQVAVPSQAEQAAAANNSRMVDLAKPPEVAKTPAVADKTPVAMAKPTPSAVESEAKQLLKTVSEKQVAEKKDILKGTGDLIQAQLLPPRPFAVTPSEAANIELKQSEGIRFQWALTEFELADEDKRKHFAEPEYYEIIIISKDGRTPARVEKSKTLDRSGIRVGPGKYAWVVRSVTKEGKRSRPSPERVFEVKYQASIAVPRILPVKVE